MVAHLQACVLCVCVCVCVCVFVRVRDPVKLGLCVDVGQVERLHPYRRVFRCVCVCACVQAVWRLSVIGQILRALS